MEFEIPSFSHLCKQLKTFIATYEAMTPTNPHKNNMTFFAWSLTDPQHRASAELIQSFTEIILSQKMLESHYVLWDKKYTENHTKTRYYDNYIIPFLRQVMCGLLFLELTKYSCKTINAQTEDNKYSDPFVQRIITTLQINGNIKNLNNDAVKTCLLALQHYLLVTELPDNIKQNILILHLCSIIPKPNIFTSEEEQPTTCIIEPIEPIQPIESLQKPAQTLAAADNDSDDSYSIVPEDNYSMVSFNEEEKCEDDVIFLSPRN